MHIENISTTSTAPYPATYIRVKPITSHEPIYTPLHITTAKLKVLKGTLTIDTFIASRGSPNATSPCPIHFKPPVFLLNPIPKSGIILENVSQFDSDLLIERFLKFPANFRLPSTRNPSIAQCSNPIGFGLSLDRIP